MSHSSAHHKVDNDLPLPLGAYQKGKVTHFAFFSSSKSVVVKLYHQGESTPFLSAPMEKTGNIHHLAIENLPSTVDYTYCCANKVVVDPYARKLTSHHTFGQPQKELRGRLSPSEPFDWGLDARPMLKACDLVIYELHVRGFTAHPSSATLFPGTFSALIEKIPYLQQLGVNVIELMPIFEFNECDHFAPPLVNYWGYDPVHFFAPMSRYGEPTCSIQNSFKALVKALHSAGMEVILDVVYNHTGQRASLLQGPDVSTYYRLKNNNHCNDSGCGHTLNCQHPIVQALILDSLREWVLEYRVDGFRFDLASILTRDEAGVLLERAPLLEKIERDPVLGATRMIAEPWDPGGAYQVGSFPSWRFAEWNGKYRDAMRLFIRGDGDKEEVKKRVSGSPDLYGNAAPTRSINYICCHDGFTLRDLVSFNQKHNSANKEENRDGSDDNKSSNCGEEGKSTNKAVLTLRERQQRNGALALFVSFGTPMWLMGDEYGHTREGNNNAWCQDNALNFFLWEKQKGNTPLFRFVSKLIALRNRFPLLKPATFPPLSDVTWYEAPNSPFLGWKLKEEILIGFNPSPNPFEWELPKQSKPWQTIVDTSLASPEDFSDQPHPFTATHHLFAPYSSALFISSQT